MVYDTDRNITWLADANYAQTSGYDADGLMDWNTAMTWVANLVYGGYDDWRLPTMLNADGGSCSDENCTGSEMGHLFYSELGVTAGNSVLTGNATRLAKFSNIQASIQFTDYWLGTECQRKIEMSPWLQIRNVTGKGALAFERWLLVFPFRFYSLSQEVLFSRS